MAAIPSLAFGRPETLRKCREPPDNAGEDEEDAILHEYPWIERPIKINYGTNITVGSNVFINKFLMDSTIVENSGYAVYNEICNQQLCTF
ncbi:hypothetical protein APSETT444_007978 [Aspergillus pseudonomiae]